MNNLILNSNNNNNNNHNITTTTTAKINNKLNSNSTIKMSNDEFQVQKPSGAIINLTSTNTTILSPKPTNSPSTPTSSNKFKSYLIEKLLNESPLNASVMKVETVMTTPSPIITTQQQLSSSSNQDKQLLNKINTKQINNNEDKEDLISEAGTYTIEDDPTAQEAHVLAKENLKSTNLEIVSARAAIDETFGIVVKRPQIENDKIQQIEDINNNNTSILKKDIFEDLQRPSIKRHSQTVRIRNKTYSLAKDIMIDSNSNNNENSNLQQQQQQQQQVSCLSSTSSASSSSHSMNDLNNQSKLKKTTTYDVISEVGKTTTTTTTGLDNNNANLESQSVCDDSIVNLNTSRTIATEVLLGDTENLIEALRKRRIEKKNQLKTKVLNVDKLITTTTTTTNSSNLNPNNNLIINSNLSSSSASSSSTNLSNDVHATTNSLKAQTWTIPTSPILNKQQEDNINNADPLSTRATVDFDYENDDNNNEEPDDNLFDDNQQSKKIGISGVAFDFNISDQPVTNKMPKNLSNLLLNRQSLNLKQEPDDNNSETSYSLSISSRSNRNSVLTITRGFEAKKNQQRENVDLNSSTSSSTPLNTPKSNATSALSLGAKIQAKAKENLNMIKTRRSSDSGSVNGSGSVPPPAPTQYTNRTLFLRQQSAKAKRDSMERTINSENSSSILNDSLNLDKKQQLSSRNNSTKQNNSILKKPLVHTTSSVSTMNRSNANMSPKSSSRQQSTNGHSKITSSRNASPNNLMTTSLNLNIGSSLPVNVADSFQRRKNYDPLKAVKLEKQKRQQQQQQQANKGQQRLPNGSFDRLDDQNNNLILDFDSMSDSSSYNSLPHQQTDNNKQFRSSEFTKSLIIDDEKSADIFKKSTLTKSFSVRANTSNRSSLVRKPSFNNGSSNNSSKITKTDNSTNKLVSNENQTNRSSYIDSSENTYEKILQSTLQRLCIRLIQMSTGVLDKIGDNNRANLCDSIQLLNTTNDLERMQLLTKLVHSMQLVHDHMQFVDMTLFNQKSEDTYIKELTKIRQEVDILKQSAVLGNQNTQTNK